MTTEAYNSYKTECHNRGLKPSSRKDLERWEDVEPTEASYSGTPFRDLPMDARLVVTKSFLVKLDSAIRREVVDAMEAQSE